MTIGEIKIQALKLMFVTYQDNISVDDLEKLGGQENYRAYLINMDGAINRAFADIERRRILPVKSYEINGSAWELRNRIARFDLKKVEDFYDVERISSESLYEYNGNAQYYRDGDHISLVDYDNTVTYRLVYYPKLARNLGDTKHIANLPDELACLIPYYVKGDLYRDDEPNEASEARNWYEQAMSEYRNPVSNVQTRVKTVYSQV
ncbi:MAG: hypothetical protein J6S14_12765 [Clostridia bacterium]|nr:hypothetical protein [Clostridia bacterium]